MVDQPGAAVDVVIPAHDEAGTVADVIGACQRAPSVGRVIVVADACTDDTARQASGPADQVLTTDARDKGSAMALGLTAVTTEAVLFVDADLEGFQWQHAEALIQLPPTRGMSVGLRDAPINGLTGRLLPPISGQRRLPTDFARQCNLQGQGYRSELLIDAAVGKARLPHRSVVMVGVTNPSRLVDEPASWLATWGELALLAIGLAPELIAYLLAPTT